MDTHTCLPSKKNDSALKVFVRVRPFLKREGQSDTSTPIVEINDSHTSKVITTLNVNQNAEITKRESYTFERCFNGATLDTMAFETENICTDEENHVFPRRTDQPLVYAYVGLPVLRNVLDGYNGCILAYGQTGSGKTFTMMGPPSVYAESKTKANANGQDERENSLIQGVEGIIPRLIRDLFKQLHQKHIENDSHSFKLELEYYEIYNEKVLDLLSSTSDDPLRIRQHTDRGVYVEGLTRKLISSEKDLFKWLKRGNIERHTGCTKMNDRSSRSHAILTLHLTQVQLSQASLDTPGIGTFVITSKLNLVDLAGSERAAASGAVGLQLQEANKINQSLTTLGRVIDALADISQGKGDVFCPYRDSALTLILKDSLGGNSKTTMVATISPHCLNFDETTQTLRYASRAKQIVTKVSVNEDPNATCIRLLTEKVKRLQACLLDENKSDQYIEELKTRIDFLESQLAEKEVLISQLKAEVANHKQDSTPSTFFPVSHSKVSEEIPVLKKASSSSPEGIMSTTAPSKVSDARQVKPDAADNQGLIISLRYELKESKKNEKELLAELEQYRKRKSAQIQKAVAEAKEEWLDERAVLSKELRELRSKYEEMEKKSCRLQEDYKNTVHASQAKKISEAISGITSNFTNQTPISALSKKAVETLRKTGLLSGKKNTLDSEDLMGMIHALVVGLDAAKEANANLLNYYASEARQELEDAEHRTWAEIYSASKTITTVKKTVRKKSRSAAKSFSRHFSGSRSGSAFFPPPPPLAFSNGENKKGNQRTNLSTPRYRLPSTYGTGQGFSSRLKLDFNTIHDGRNDFFNSTSPTVNSTGQTVTRLPSGKADGFKDMTNTSFKSPSAGATFSLSSQQSSPHVDPVASPLPKGKSLVRQQKYMETRGKEGKVENTKNKKNVPIVGKKKEGKHREEEKGKSGSRSRRRSTSSVRHTCSPECKPQLHSSFKSTAKEKKKSKSSVSRTGGAEGNPTGLPSSSKALSLSSNGVPPIPLPPTPPVPKISEKDAADYRSDNASICAQLMSENEKLKSDVKSLSSKVGTSELRVRILNQLLQTRERMYEGVNKIGVNPASVIDTVVNIESAARKEWENEESLHCRMIIQQMNLHKHYLPLITSLRAETENLAKSLHKETEKRDHYAKEAENVQEDNRKLMEANELVVTKNKFLKQQIQNEKELSTKKEEELRSKVLSLEKEVKEAQERFSQFSSSENDKVALLTTELTRVTADFEEKQSHLQSQLEEMKEQCTQWAASLEKAEEEKESQNTKINALQSALDHSKAEVEEFRHQLTMQEDSSTREKRALEDQLRDLQDEFSPIEEKLQRALEELSEKTESLLTERADHAVQLESIEAKLEENEKLMKEELSEITRLHQGKEEKLQKQLETLESDAQEHQLQLQNQLKAEAEVHDHEVKTLQENMKKDIHELMHNLECEKEKAQETEEKYIRLQEEFHELSEKCKREEAVVDCLTNQLKALEEVRVESRRKEKEEKREVARLLNEQSLNVEKIEAQKVELLLHEKNIDMLTAQGKMFESRIAELLLKEDELHKEHAKKLKEAKVTLETSKSEWIFEKEHLKTAIESLTAKVKKQEEETEKLLKEKDEELLLLKEAQEKVLQECVALEGEKLSAEELLRQKVELLDTHKKVVDQRNIHLQSTIASLQEELKEKEAEIQELKDLNLMQNHLDRVEEQSNFSGMESTNGTRINSLTRLSTLIQKKIFRYRNNENKVIADFDSPFANNSFCGENMTSSDPNFPSFSPNSGPVSSIHEMLSAKVDCSSALLRAARPSAQMRPSADFGSPSKSGSLASGNSPPPSKSPIASNSSSFMHEKNRSKPRLSPPPAASKQVLRFTS